MADVYISYDRGDREIARQLADLLQLSGLTVFFDMDALVSGHEFTNTIAEALRQAKAVVVLLSANTRRSSWVQHELSSVIEKKDGPLVIPVLLDHSAKENWVWPLVSNRQSIDLAERPEKLNEVAVQLREALGVVEASPPSCHSRTRIQHPYIFAAAAILMITAAAMFWSISGTDDELPSGFEKFVAYALPLVSGLIGVLVGILLGRLRK